AAIGAVAAGARLAIALPFPAFVHWGRDGWLAAEDTPPSATGLGSHVAVLPTATLPPGGWIDFTWRWQDSGEWTGNDARVEGVAAPQPLASSTTPQPASRAAK